MRNQHKEKLDALDILPKSISAGLDDKKNDDTNTGGEMSHKRTKIID